MFIDDFVVKCVGYCGVDLKVLCIEVVVYVFRRRYL